MKRFVPYLGIAVAFVFFTLVIVFANQVSVVQPPAASNTPVASSTLSVEPGFVLPPITPPSLAPATNTSAASSAPAAPVPKKVAPKTEPTPIPVAAPVPAPVPIAPSAGNAALDTAATALRGALVNILCYVPAGSGLHSISGSGIFIDPKGIILTNAHIAQYFLLANKGASCTIRTGSPAADAYEASLIYISPVWLNANASVLTQALPSGTGEYDFGLLAVTKSVTSNALPDSFSSLPLATMPPSAGTPVVIASFGAQFLESSQIQSDLFPTIVFGSIKDVFTFGTNTVDVVALGGSVAAQEGSSGGGVADSSGALVATITTSTVTGSTDTRSLNAITASYIRAEYATEMGSALDLLLAQPVVTSVAEFAAKIPMLEAIITPQLP